MGKIVDLVTAKKVASRFLNSIRKDILSGGSSASEETDIVFRADSLNTVFKSFEKIKKSKNKIEETGEPCFYIVQAKDKGFAIVSADESCEAVLGFSASGRIDVNNMPPALEYLLECYRLDILNTKENKTAATKEIQTQWKNLKSSVPSTRKPADISKISVVVPPLIKTQWDQGYPYSHYGPHYYDSKGKINIYYPAGCIAIAMAQIINYYAYPEYGKGKTFKMSKNDLKNYNNCPGITVQKGPSGLTIIFADLESTKYPYKDMNFNIIRRDSPVKYISPIAMLIRHCAISVNMQYGEKGSSADDSSATEKLHKHFGFNSVDHEYDNRTPGGLIDLNWDTRLRNELKAGRPVLYGGHYYIKNGKCDGGGHLFICDGYAENNYFHFNWGWGPLSKNDGYYKTFEGLNTSNGTYNRIPRASFGLRPNKNIHFITVLFKGEMVVENILPEAPGDDINGENIIFPYGKVPVVEGCSRTFRIKSNKFTYKNMLYKFEHISYGGKIERIDERNFDEILYSGRQDFTVKNVNSDVTLEIIAFPVEQFEIGGVYYIATDIDSAEVAGISENAPAEIIIPEKVELHGNKFYVSKMRDGCFANNKKLTKLTAKFVKEIGKAAFSGCTELQEVYLDSIETIPEKAFYMCKKLKRADCKENRYIEESSFEGCSGLLSIDIPVYNVADKAFRNCTQLSKVGAGTYINRVGNYAFENCHKLIFNSKSVLDRAVEIGEFAFSGCYALNADIQNRIIKSVGNGAFQNCKNILNVSLTVAEETGASTFENCIKLIKTEIPKVKTISMSLFKGCVCLRDVQLHKNLQIVGVGAFQDTAVESLDLPNSLNKIGLSSFAGCKKIKKIVSSASNPPVCAIDSFKGVDTKIPVFVPYESIEKYKAATGWKNFTNYQIPEIEIGAITYRILTHDTAQAISFDENKISLNLITPLICVESYIKWEGRSYKVLSIKENTFSGSQVKSAVIGIVNKVGQYAFANCSNLREITTREKTPPAVYKNTFEGLYASEGSKVKENLKHIKLRVPKDYVEEYSKHSIWQLFTIEGYRPDASGVYVPPALERDLKLQRFKELMRYDMKEWINLIKIKPREISQVFDDIRNIEKISGGSMKIPAGIEKDYIGMNQRESLSLQEGIDALKIVNVMLSENVDIIKKAFAGTNIKTVKEIAAVNISKRSKMSEVAVKQIREQEMFYEYYQMLEFYAQHFEEMLESLRKTYYVSKRAQKGREHELHAEGCKFMPAESNRIELGIFLSETEALEEAMMHYTNTNGCYYCCPETDTDKLKRSK